MHHLCGRAVCSGMSLIDGKTVKVRAGVDRAVRGNAKELELADPRRLAKSRILPYTPVAETTHELKNRPFTIHDIFLSVLMQNSPRISQKFESLRPRGGLIRSRVFLTAVASSGLVAKVSD